jgi:hypothetical protein
VDIIHCAKPSILIYQALIHNRGGPDGTFWRGPSPGTGKTFEIGYVLAGIGVFRDNHGFP